MKKGMIVKKALENRFCFDLLAPDGMVLCRSGRYATEEECLKGIESLRACCRAPVSETACPGYGIRRNEAGEIRFSLRDETGGVLAESLAFRVDYTCMRAVRAVGEYAPDAQTVVPTDFSDVSVGQALHV